MFVALLGNKRPKLTIVQLLRRGRVLARLAATPILILDESHAMRRPSIPILVLFGDCQAGHVLVKHCTHASR